MPDQDNQNPSTGSQSDISKSQSQQQPTGQGQDREPSGESRQFETGSQSDSERSGDQAQTGQSQTGQSQSGSPDEGLQGDTQTQQRTDVEGAGQSESGGVQSGEFSGESGSGFVGSQGQQDSSSELVDEEDEDFARDGQGAPDGQ